MLSFGFAAFLKIASLNPKPRRTELRKRIYPGESKPYDFHRRLKLASGKHVVAGLDLAALIADAETINPLPERKAMVAGLKKLGIWLESTPGAGFKPDNRVFESPRSLFKISFQPEFGLENGSKRIAFHLWNTQKPALKHGAVYSTLALMANLYDDLDDCPDDFGLVSLHEPKAYRLSDASAHRYAASSTMIDWIEDLILDIQSDGGLGTGDHDPPPPWP
jgi:hypothetical protein